MSISIIYEKRKLLNRKKYPTIKVGGVEKSSAKKWGKAYKLSGAAARTSELHEK